MSNQEQIDYWNGEAGDKWVSFSAQLDAMLKPFADTILETAKITSNDDILDIGCGAGALSLMAAQKGQSVTGIDISSPLIGLAQKRAAEIPNTSFQIGDAQTMALSQKFDLAISRFGVMFFDDPVTAFTHIRHQMKPSGRLVFACWQSPMKNLWARAPFEAAIPYLKEPPSPPQPHTPGPFGLADREHIKTILESSAWSSVQITEWSGDIQLPGQDISESAAFMMQMGPLSRILKEQDVDTSLIHQSLLAIMEDFRDQDGFIKMPASAWIVSASI